MLMQKDIMPNKTQVLEGGGPDPAFPSPFHDNPASCTLFIGESCFPGNSQILNPENTLPDPENQL